MWTATATATATAAATATRAAAASAAASCEAWRSVKRRREAATVHKRFKASRSPESGAREHQASSIRDRVLRVVCDLKGVGLS